VTPRPGDIVWCRSPEDLTPRPGPKPRLALVTAVGAIDGEPAVMVAYGTSQKTNRLTPGNPSSDQRMALRTQPPV